jgi:hypothetical protein
MTEPNGEIALDEPSAVQTYTQTQGTVRDHRDQIPDHDDAGIDDPAISRALRGHNNKTKTNIDDTDSSLDSGKRAARGLADADQASAARTRNNPGAADPGALASLRNALANSPGPASPFAGPASAAPASAAMPAEAPQTPMTYAAPATVNLAPDALAKLLAGAGVDGTTEGAPDASRLSGSAGGRQPLPDAGVACRPIGQTLTRAQLASVIDQALDNNGVSTNPEVRAHWRDILYNQAMKESSGVPDAINRDDSNAHLPGPRRADGGPPEASRGIWQLETSTFAAHHIGGTSNNIFDPVANGSAAAAYMMSEYHVTADGTGLTQFHTRRAAAGYGAY